jgi:hypothetical protein
MHGPSTASLAAAELAKYGPRNATCPAQPGSSEHAVEVYLAARPRGEAVWYVVAPGLTPYRHRLRAKLTTGSDFAVCRGKRGATSYQSCTCRAQALETTTHALFECEFYDAIRSPLIAASAAWCLVSRASRPTTPATPLPSSGGLPPPSAPRVRPPPPPPPPTVCCATASLPFMRRPCLSVSTNPHRSLRTRALPPSPPLRSPE